jgi:hypothetical protein
MGDLTQREDEWGRRATAAAIAAARKIVLGEAAALKNAPMGRLSDIEWGWIVTSIIFAWIATRAEQATTEGLDAEQTIRMSMLDPNPWDAGMIAAVLPKLADAPGVDWAMPLADWSRESMIAFLFTVLGLIREATIARDLADGSITRRTGYETAILDDPIPSW